MSFRRQVLRVIGAISFNVYMYLTVGFPGGSDGRESACNAGTPRFDPWLGKIAWRRAWQPTPVFLPRECHGQRSLVGYHPWGCKRVRHDLAQSRLDGMGEIDCPPKKSEVGMNGTQSTQALTTL